MLPHVWAKCVPKTCQCCPMLGKCVRTACQCIPMFGQMFAIDMPWLVKLCAINLPWLPIARQWCANDLPMQTHDWAIACHRLEKIGTLLGILFANDFTWLPIARRLCANDLPMYHHCRANVCQCCPMAGQLCANDLPWLPIALVGKLCHRLAMNLQWFPIFWPMRAIDMTMLPHVGQMCANGLSWRPIARRLCDNFLPMHRHGWANVCHRHAMNANG